VISLLSEGGGAARLATPAWTCGLRIAGDLRRTAPGLHSNEGGIFSYWPTLGLTMHGDTAWPEFYDGGRL
jgi:hypothetical protein